jgi:hypothetical protein
MTQQTEERPTVEQLEADLEAQKEFYMDVINDLKGQITIMADQKATQTALKKRAERDVAYQAESIKALEAQIMEMTHLDN